MALDLAIVLAFIIYSVTAGFIARKKASRGLGEYFLAGKGLKGWQAGTSMAATQFAADTPLLVTGLIATGGIFMVWRLWIYGLAFLLMGFLFAAHWQRAKVLTDAELTELRYSGQGVLLLRVIKAIYYGTLFNCVVLAWVLFATVGIAETFLPWHTWLPAWLYDPIQSIATLGGFELVSKDPQIPVELATTNNIISIAIIVIFTTLYSMTGGLRGVVATDVVQFILALLGTFIFAWIVVKEVGGLGALTGRVVDIYGHDRASEMLSFAPKAVGEGGGLSWAAIALPFLTVWSMQWLFQINADGTGYLAQRSMACENEVEARYAGVLFAWLQIFLRSLPWLLIGVGLLVVYPFGAGDVADANFTARRELWFVRGANELLPPGAKGLLLTGMLAALASTLDTHMNWGASYWSNDIYKRLICRSWLNREPSGRETVIIARLSNLVVLTLALIIMVNLNSIAQAWRISLLFGAGVGSVLVLRWIWERINLWSEFAAMIVSLVLAPILLALGDHWQEAGVFPVNGDIIIEAINLGVMGLVSTIAAIGVAFITPPTDRETRHGFYRQVRPAGWWGRTASEAGDDPSRPTRELRSELLTTVITAASLYLCLYGGARLLVPHPDLSWIWPGLALLIGIAIAPIWWRKTVKLD